MAAAPATARLRPAGSGLRLLGWSAAAGFAMVRSSQGQRAAPEHRRGPFRLCGRP